MQVAAGAHGDGRQLVLGRLDAQHGQVAVGEGADQLGVVGALVGQRHLGAVGALDDVEVGDDVAGRVPDEAGAGAARHLLHVQLKTVALRGQRGDVHHAGRGLCGRARCGPVRRRPARRAAPPRAAASVRLSTKPGTSASAAAAPTASSPGAATKANAGRTGQAWLGMGKRGRQRCYLRPVAAMSRARFKRRGTSAPAWTGLRSSPTAAAPAALTPATLGRVTSGSRWWSPHHQVVHAHELRGALDRVQFGRRRPCTGGRTRRCASACSCGPATCWPWTQIPS
jgi:hypothetical protein